jgi:ABC-type antimicrobial peptide transport system permease subunit
VQRHVMAMIELDRAVNRVLMFVILFMAAMGVANSILMGIMERIREFGVMMAVGTTTRQVIRMVVVETLLLTVVGVVIGNVLGILITLYFGHRGFDLRLLTKRDLIIDGSILQTVNYPSVHWHNSLMVTVVILVLALVVSVFPARHISKLSAVQALRAH